MSPAAIAPHLGELLDQVNALPVLCTARDVQQVLGLGRSATYALLRSTELTTLPVGEGNRSLRVTRASLVDYVQRRARGGAGQPAAPNANGAGSRGQSPNVPTPHGAPRRTARKVKAR
jgi:hypothetical protein